MSGEATDVGLKEHILRHLRDHYPIKIDEAVLISAIRSSIEGASPDQIGGCIDSLKDEGLIEESFIKVPFGKMDTYRFKITPSGIEHLQLKAGAGTRNASATLMEIESRLTDTYDCMRADMEKLGHETEMKIGELEESINRLSDRVASLSKELTAVKGLVETYAGKAEDEMLREEQLVLRVLSGDERTLYDIILNAGGQMFQKDLVTRSRMSNAKVSRIVDHLESRGILIRERHGATNRLRITVKPPQEKANPLLFH